MESTAKNPTELKLVKIFVNNRPVEVEKETTGAGIKAAAEVPENFKLYDPEGAEVGDIEQLRVRLGEKFIAISGQDVS